MLHARRIGQVGIALFSLIASAMVLSACTSNEQASDGAAVNEAKATGQLVAYYSRKEEFAKPLLEKFTKDTGIEVKGLFVDTNGVNRIQSEANNVQADIFLSNDVGEMEYLRKQSLLEASDPKGIESIQANFRAADNSWIGLSARTRIIMYNKDLVTEADLPKRIEDLADDRYKGQFMITRGGNGSMIAHVSALRKVWGDDKTLQWLTKIGQNAGRIVSGHGDIRKAVGAGEYKFGLVNNYYYHLQLAEPSDNNVGVIYPDQADGESGAFLNAAGVASIKGGPNTVSKQAFLDWLLLEENQKEFSFASLEVPTNPNVETSKGALRIDQYRTMNFNLGELGEMWIDSKELIEKSGLALELK
jgi:iron(III) transport system substrate-binding protein